MYLDSKKIKTKSHHLHIITIQSTLVMWTVLGKRLQQCIWIQLITLSLSPSLPIQSNEPIGSALDFNVSSIASWSDS